MALPTPDDRPVERKFLVGGSLVRFAAGILLVVSVAYSGLHTIPVVVGDLHLLNDVYAADVKGISLEGALLKRAEEGRRRFLRVVLGAGDQAEVDKQIGRLRACDSEVLQSNAAIAVLGVVPGANQRGFLDSWNQYTALRDGMIAMTVRGESITAIKKVENDFGQTSFLRVEHAIASSKDAFDASSASHVKAISTALGTALRELLISLAATILCLALLVWMDWKRTRTEKKLMLATRDLKASEDRFRQAYQSVAVGMGIFTLDGTVVSMNLKAAEILGCEPDELLGTKVSQFMAPEFHDDHVHRIASLPGSGERSYQTERRIIRKDGKSVWVRNSVTLLKSEGTKGYYFAISEEITRQKEALDRLVYLANFDPVTNLPNLRSFEARLKELMAETGHGCDGIALLYMEIDSFDFVKDTFGRAIADEVLADVSSALGELRHKAEMVARLDDHTFGMLVRAAPYDEATLVKGDGTAGCISPRRSGEQASYSDFGIDWGGVYGGGWWWERDKREWRPRCQRRAGCCTAAEVCAGGDA